MVALPSRWRGVPEFLILVGSVTGMVLTVVSLAWNLAGGSAAAEPGGAAVSAFGFALAATLIVPIRWRRVRTARSFVYAALVATALATLSYAGLIGGGLALGGAMWGMVETYAPHP